MAAFSSPTLLRLWSCWVRGAGKPRPQEFGFVAARQPAPLWAEWLATEAADEEGDANQDEQRGRAGLGPRGQGDRVPVVGEVVIVDR